MVGLNPYMMRTLIPLVFDINTHSLHYGNIVLYYQNIKDYMCNVHVHVCLQKVSIKICF